MSEREVGRQRERERERDREFGIVYMSKVNELEGDKDIRDEGKRLS